MTIDQIQLEIAGLDRRVSHSEETNGFSISDDIQLQLVRFLGEIACQLIRLNARPE